MTLDAPSQTRLGSLWVFAALWVKWPSRSCSPLLSTRNISPASSQPRSRVCSFWGAQLCFWSWDRSRAWPALLPFLLLLLPKNPAANPDSSLQLPAELGFWDSSELWAQLCCPSTSPEGFPDFYSLFSCSSTPWLLVLLVLWEVWAFPWHESICAGTTHRFFTQTQKPQEFPHKPKPHRTMNSSCYFPSTHLIPAGFSCRAPQHIHPGWMFCIFAVPGAPDPCWTLLLARLFLGGSRCTSPILGWAGPGCCTRALGCASESPQCPHSVPSMSPQWQLCVPHSVSSVTPVSPQWPHSVPHSVPTITPQWPLSVPHNDPTVSHIVASVSPQFPP